MTDEEAKEAISTIVYGSGIRIQNVFKTMNTSGDGVDDNQLVEGLQKLGVRVE